jgi:hypothetical protein
MIPRRTERRSAHQVPPEYACLLRHNTDALLLHAQMTQRSTSGPVDTDRCTGCTVSGRTITETGATSYISTPHKLRLRSMNCSRTGSVSVMLLCVCVCAFLCQTRCVWGRRWVDKGTRAVAHTFSVYNTNTRLLTVVRLTVEFMHSGDIQVCGCCGKGSVLWTPHVIWLSGFSHQISYVLLPVRMVMYDGKIGKFRTGLEIAFGLMWLYQVCRRCCICCTWMVHLILAVYSCKKK